VDRSRDGQRVPKLHITNEDDLKAAGEKLTRYVAAKAARRGAK